MTGVPLAEESGPARWGAPLPRWSAGTARTEKYQGTPDSREVEGLALWPRGDIVLYGVPGTPPMVPGQYA